MFKEGITHKSMNYAVPAVQRKLVQTARALFRGTVRDKVTGGGRKGRKNCLPSLRCLRTIPSQHGEAPLHHQTSIQRSGWEQKRAPPLAITYPSLQSTTSIFWGLWCAETLNPIAKSASYCGCSQQRTRNGASSWHGEWGTRISAFHLCLCFTLRPCA